MSAPLLRHDLIIVSTATRDNNYLVRDPRTGEIFAFGETEFFLLDGIRRPYTEQDLFSAFQARFGESINKAEFDEFLALLKQWDLLEASPADRSPQTSEPHVAEHHPENLTSENNQKIEHPQTEQEVARLRHDLQPSGGMGDIVSSAEDTSRQSKRRSFPNHWRLFDPERLLDLLLAFFSPLAPLTRLLPFLGLVSVLGLVIHWNAVVADLAEVSQMFGLAGHFIITMFTVNLVTQLARGMVARSLGLRVPSLGVTLAYGILPRFDVRIDPRPDLESGSKIRLASTSLQVRFVLLSVGALIWLLTRSTGTLLPLLGVALAIFSAISLLFVANPLLNSDGYRLLSLYVGIPNLRQRANRALRSYFKRTPAVIARYSEDSFGLKIYALSSILFIAILAGFVALFVAARLESEYRGTGVVLFLILLFILVAHFRRQVRHRREAGMPEADSRDTGGDRTTPAEEGTLRPRRRDTEGTPRTKSTTPTIRVHAGSILRLLLVLAFLGCMFLPYQYETGGVSEIMPMVQQELYAETPGIVQEIYFEGGEWVKRGAIVGILSDHRQRKDVRVTIAAITRQREIIERLRTTPSEAEIELAKQQIAIARLESKYSTSEANRLETLYKQGNLSLGNYESVQKTRDVDRQQVLEKEANLWAIKSQVNPNEIDAAKAEETRLTEELQYYEEQLQRTRIRAPIDGRIVTMNLRNLQNKYLEEGDLFIVIEDDSKVKVKISVPESDIGEVAEGNPVRLKVWAFPATPFFGRVTEIYATASERGFGRVIDVISVMDNDQGLLRTGMTGYAKIQGREMSVAEAFSRALMRFVEIEIWSWIP